MGQKNYNTRTHMWKFISATLMVAAIPSIISIASLTPGVVHAEVPPNAVLICYSLESKILRTNGFIAYTLKIKDGVVLKTTPTQKLSIHDKYGFTFFSSESKIDVFQYVTSSPSSITWLTVDGSPSSDGEYFTELSKAAISKKHPDDILGLVSFEYQRHKASTETDVNYRSFVHVLDRSSLKLTTHQFSVVDLRLEGMSKSDKPITRSDNTSSTTVYCELSDESQAEKEIEIRIESDAIRNKEEFDRNLKEAEDIESLKKL